MFALGCVLYYFFSWLAPRILKLNAVGFGFADVPWSATLMGLVEWTLLSTWAEYWGFHEDYESAADANSLLY